MQITISNNPIDKFLVWIDNKREDYTQKVWQKKPHYVKCRLCGSELHSQDYLKRIKDEYSPEQCGWRRLKDKDGWNWGWICHSCDGHFHEHWVNKDEVGKFINLDIENKYTEINDAQGNILKRLLLSRDINVTVDIKKIIKLFGIEINEDAEYIDVNYEIKE